MESPTYRTLGEKCNLTLWGAARFTVSFLSRPGVRMLYVSLLAVIMTPYNNCYPGEAAVQACVGLRSAQPPLVELLKSLLSLTLHVITSKNCFESFCRLCYGLRTLGGKNGLFTMHTRKAYAKKALPYTPAPGPCKGNVHTCIQCFSQGGRDKKCEHLTPSTSS